MARNDFIKEIEADKRSAIIALSALKFYLLNALPKTTIKFNPKDSISFTGKTGPYLLYSYARLQSILEKGKEKLLLEELDFKEMSKNKMYYGTANQKGIKVINRVPKNFIIKVDIDKFKQIFVNLLSNVRRQ